MSAQFFNDFIATATSHTKEVSLMIADSEVQLEDFKRELEHKGFAELSEAASVANALAKGERVFSILRRSSAKEMYDLLAQYPTGQVELFDNQTKHPYVVTPNKDATFILLTTRQDLAALEEHGFPIRSVVGLAYQR